MDQRAKFFRAVTFVFCDQRSMHKTDPATCQVRQHGRKERCGKTRFAAEVVERAECLERVVLLPEGCFVAA